MVAGDVEGSPYSNSSNELSASWSDFWSDLGIWSYHLGISTQPFEEWNQTFACEVLFSLADKHFDVSPLVNIKRDMFARVTGLELEHNVTYYLSVIGSDIAGQCIASKPAHVLVDLTPPESGIVNIGGPSHNAQYIPDPDKLVVHFNDFHDPESGIQSFHFQVYSSYYVIIGVRRRYQYIQTIIISTLNLDRLIMAGILKHW